MWAVVIGIFMVVQTAALYIYYWYELPLQKRLRSLLLQRREVGRGALRLHSDAAAHAMRRHLLIVARDNGELTGHRQAEFLTRPEVEMLVDRRLVERRQSAASVVSDRRQTDRRARPSTSR